MRIDLRETGSIRVSAAKDEVLDVLERHLAGSARVASDRLEARGSTYVVRESEGGTVVFHMRREQATLTRALRERDELRREVQSDLFQLRRALDALAR